MLSAGPHLLRLLEQSAADFAVPFPFPRPVAYLKCVMGGRSRRIREGTLNVNIRGAPQIRGIHVDGAITILIILEHGGIKPVSQLFSPPSLYAPIIPAAPPRSHLLESGFLILFWSTV